MTDIVHLDRSDIKRLLERCEAEFERETGVRLSSEEFYEKYLRGEQDGMFTMAWSTYYEAYLRLDDPVRRIEDAMPPVRA